MLFRSQAFFNNTTNFSEMLFSLYHHVWKYHLAPLPPPYDQLDQKAWYEHFFGAMSLNITLKETPELHALPYISHIKCPDNVTRREKGSFYVYSTIKPTNWLHPFWEPYCADAFCIVQQKKETSIYTTPYQFLERHEDQLPEFCTEKEYKDLIEAAKKPIDILQNTEKEEWSEGVCWYFVYMVVTRLYSILLAPHEAKEYMRNRPHRAPYLQYDVDEDEEIESTERYNIDKDRKDERYKDMLKETLQHYVKDRKSTRLNSSH